MSNVGDNLLYLRKKKNLTQKQVADLLGVSHVTYQQYESGKTEPNIERLNQLASLFGVPVGTLTGHSKLEIIDTFGTRLQKLRRLKGESQLIVAESIGISVRSYATYENESREPTASTLEKLADYFDVSVDYLMCRGEMKPRGTEMEEYWWNLFLRCDEEDRAKLFETIKIVHDRVMSERDKDCCR